MRKPQPNIEKAQLWLLAGLLAVWCHALAQEGGSLRAENLRRQPVNVPSDLAPNAVLVVSLSRAASDQIRPWWEALLAARDEGGFTPYRVLVIEDAPGFVRGMIRRTVRKRTHESRRAQVLLVNQGADAWRSYLRAEDDAIAHVARLDDGGGVCLRRSGPLTDEGLLAIVSGGCE